jgi:hypothetical protein
VRTAAAARSRLGDCRHAVFRLLARALAALRPSRGFYRHGSDHAKRERRGFAGVAEAALGRSRQRLRLVLWSPTFRSHANTLANSFAAGLRPESQRGQLRQATYADRRPPMVREPTHRLNPASIASMPEIRPGKAHPTQLGVGWFVGFGLGHGLPENEDGLPDFLDSAIQSAAADLGAHERISGPFWVGWIV